MKAVNGYIENGRFTPLDVITLPRRVQAVLVYNDVTDDGRAERMTFLKEFHNLGREAAGEDMPDFPRVKFCRELVDLSDDEVMP